MTTRSISRFAKKKRSLGTDVVDGDAAAAVVLVVASLLQRIRVPPSLLQSFQLALIQQFQDARTNFNF